MLNQFVAASPPVFVTKGTKPILLQRPSYTWARGYCFDSSDNVALDNAVVDCVLHALSGGADLSAVMSQLNGHFAIMLYYEDEQSLICCLDRYGTIPLFYNKSQEKLYISDRAVEVAWAADLKAIKPSAVVEMLRLGYVTGSKTLIEEVEEIPFASIVRFQYTQTGWEIDTQRLWAYSFANATERPVSELRDQLVEIVATVARRYEKAIQSLGGQAAVPLSGGLDSRLLIAVLANNLAGVVSYGHPDSEEIAVASQVARAANLQHHIVATHRHEQFLKRELVRRAVFDIGATARFNCGVGVRIVAQQRYPFNVWLPGHSADFIAGSHISRGTLLVHSENEAVQFVSDSHCLLNDEWIERLTPDGAQPKTWQQTIAEQLSFSSKDPVGSVERWDCEQRQRRMIFTDLRAYETMGHWLIPLWDNELVDYFCSLPLKHKYKQNLYVDTLIDRVFVGEFAGLGRIPRAEKGDLRSVHLGLKDQLVLAHLPNVVAHTLFRRGSAKKFRLRNAPCILPPTPPNEPDPITRWWFDSLDFRHEIINELTGWDGLGGLVNVPRLQSLLGSDELPCNFIRYGVPALLTMRVLQMMLAEGAGNNVQPRWDQ